MSKGDLALWTGLVTIVAFFAICLVMAVIRSFGKPPATDDQSEFETFWRGRR